jgi:hypothetical protein
MNNQSPRLSDKATRQIEDGFRNDEEAHALLDLINAEFQSDPTSTQCFDLRLVERVKWCVARRTAYLKANPWMRS